MHRTLEKEDGLSPYYPLAEAESRLFVYGLLTKEGSLIDHVQR